MDLESNNKQFLTFSRKLFLSVVALFIVFSICFLSYQYQREKVYKVELLHSKLQDYNARLHENFDSIPNSNEIVDFLNDNVVTDLRVTVISHDGHVIYDTSETDTSKMDNHKNRIEIQEALKKKKGYDVRRTSETTGVPYFYSATNYPDYIIRTAVPYDVTLANYLKADAHFFWFTGLIILILLFIFYKWIQRLSTSINQLREFAMRADRNEAIDMDMHLKFPHNELGDISQHIIQIYKRLHETKEALYIEREKLITHLQISHEGLGVFNRNKKEILVNNLFTQFCNLIADDYLETAEDVFSVKEFKSINDFINKSHTRRWEDEEKRMSIAIHKNGRTFVVECIMFQDLSFEISINDITLEEEQSKMKRQLTQNIAHELKTPVSSIQGYLETMVSNENIPRDKMTIFLERCYAQSNRLSRLLRDISVLTRMDEAATMIDMEMIDISQLVGSMINEVSLELEEKQIHVANLLKNNIKIKGNYSLIYSIFRNLTDNAIAYAGTNINITINCFREDEHYFYFSFADTGIGVAPEHLSRLFERFYRIDKGRSRKLGGTGLGLAIVKNAVIIHKGSISAKINSHGGLEFIFTLAKGK